MPMNQEDDLISAPFPTHTARRLCPAVGRIVYNIMRGIQTSREKREENDYGFSRRASYLWPSEERPIAAVKTGLD
jgi:hypothetical protein